MVTASFCRRCAGVLGAALLALAVARPVLAEQRFLSPGSGEALTAGTAVEVRWTAPCPDGTGSPESELLLSLDGGLTFPIRLTAEMSACAKGLRWNVPAVESRHARLGLRSGSGEQSEDETLEIVSDEFTIAAPRGEDTADLMAGTRELWTREALEGVGLEDLPSEAMTGAAEQLVVPASSADVSEPTPPGLPAPEPSAAPLPSDSQSARVPSARGISARSISPLPLRL